MTALNHTTKVFAVQDCKIAAMTADTTGAPTYNSVIDVPGIQKVGMTFDMTNVTLSGDNVLLESDSILVGVKLTFDHAKLNFDVLQILIGGTVADTGATPNRQTSYVRAGTDVFSYFKLEAATPTSGVDTIGGDLHLLVEKCKVTGYNLGFAEEDYQIFSGAADGVFTASSNELFRLVMNETSSAITV
jgi:hypothetical protein